MDETFEISVCSDENKHSIYIGPVLKNVTSDETFQSLFERMMSGLIASNDSSTNGTSIDAVESHKTTNNNTTVNNADEEKIDQKNSVSTATTVTRNDANDANDANECQIQSESHHRSLSGFGSISNWISVYQEMDVICECAMSQKQNVCEITLEFNVLQICKRHNFVSICYRIRNSQDFHFPRSSNNMNNTSHASAVTHALAHNHNHNHNHHNNIRKKETVVVDHESDLKLREINDNANDEHRTPDASSKSLPITSPPQPLQFFELAQQLHRHRSRDFRDKRSALKKHPRKKKSYKQYTYQESLLTLLLSVPEFKSMYFIFLAGFLLFFASMLIDDFLNEGEIFHSVTLVQWNFTNVGSNFHLWFYMFLYSYSQVFLFYTFYHRLYLWPLLYRIICSITHSRWKHKHNRNRKHGTQLANGNGNGIPKKERTEMNARELEYHNGRILDLVYIVVYICYQIPLMIFPMTWTSRFNIAGSLIISAEQCRFVMKSHAFFVETLKTKRYYTTLKHNNNKKKTTTTMITAAEAANGTTATATTMTAMANGAVSKPSQLLSDVSEETVHKNGSRTRTTKGMATDTDTDTEESTAKKLPFPWIVDIDLSFADMVTVYTYFLFIPVLVFRTTYPRTKSIRWSIVMYHLRNVFLSVISVWIVFCRNCIPEYRVTVENPGTFASVFSSTVSASIPGTLLLVLGFYGFLHSWLNMFAELLTFGDRQFYDDWWNARSFAQYYRKWNCVVHDWIYNYLYLPVLECGYTTSFAMFIVFGTSSLIHEYILYVGFKMFYPVLLVLFGGMGVFFVPFTRLWRNARMWNIFLWSMLLIGQGILVVVYMREFYARNDPKALKLVDQASWVPSSWQLLWNNIQKNVTATLDT